MNKAERLGQDKISRLLWQFSLPAMTGMAVNAFYNVIDSIFVGQGVGSVGLTAVALAFPVVMIQMGLAMLVGIGATSLISIRLGEARPAEAEALLGNAFILLLLIGFSLTLGVLFLLEPLLVLLGADSEVLPYAKTFTTILMLGNVFLYIGFGLNNIIRAEGNPAVAMKTMLLSAGLNTVLNPLFIFGLQWGIAGSALATVISQLVTACWVLTYFLLGKSLLKLKRCYFRLKWRRCYEIAVMGLSSFLMQAAASVVIFFYNQTLLAYGGTLAVAAMGIINRIVLFVLMPVFGINQAMQPLVGYNYGARKFDRVQEALKLSILGASLLCSLGFIVVQSAARPVISLFTADPALVELGATGLRTVMAMFPIVGFQIVGGNYFQAVGKPVYTMVFSLSRQVFLLIPLIWLLPQWFGLNGIWLAAPGADGLSAVFTAFFLWREWRYLRATGSSG